MRTPHLSASPPTAPKLEKADQHPANRRRIRRPCANWKGRAVNERSETHPLTQTQRLEAEFERKVGNRSPGSLTTFLRKLEQGLRRGEVETPCNGCTACCRDPKLFVHLGEDEAPHYRAHRQGADWHLDRQPSGECVYLIDNRCSIRSNRPRTCREYDCRLHLLGLPLDFDQKVLIEEGPAYWQDFSLPTTEDKIIRIAIGFAVIAESERDPSPAGFMKAMQTWPAYREMAR
jgi:Putative zinc- or iron-chelating domain